MTAEIPLLGELSSWARTASAEEIADVLGVLAVSLTNRGDEAGIALASVALSIRRDWALAGLEVGKEKRDHP